MVHGDVISLTFRRKVFCSAGGGMVVVGLGPTESGEMDLANKRRSKRFQRLVVAEQLSSFLDDRRGIFCECPRVCHER